MSARRAAIAALALAALGVPGGASPAQACGCGIALESTVSEERALVVETAGHERIVLSLDLAGDPGGRPAVVLPVPAVPEVEAIEHGDPLAYLDAATAPVEPGAVGGGAPDATAAPPVDVIGRETVGGYDVARLASGEAGALDKWLRRNGYSLPSRAEPILADYIDQGWRFVAIRLAPGDEGRLKPLDVSFATDSPIYPMRLEQLASTPVDLTLYTLAGGPRAIDGLQTAYQGSVTALDPPPPPQLAALFAQGSEVTRLEASGVSPATFTEDLAIEPVAAPFDTEERAGASDSDWEEIGAIAAAVALMAFAIFAVLTRPDKGATSIDGTDGGP